MFIKKYDVVAKQPLQAVPYAKVAGTVAPGGLPAMPPGTIVAFGGDLNHLPKGWLLCDGNALNAYDNNQQYLKLFQAIDINWGFGDNRSGSFNLPTLQGYFLRGASNGSTYSADPDADKRKTSWGVTVGGVVGSYQGDALQQHNHNWNVGSGTPDDPNHNNDVYGRIDANNISIATTGATNCNVSSETRPRNAAVNYIIKY